MRPGPLNAVVVERTAAEQQALLAELERAVDDLRWLDEYIAALRWRLGGEVTETAPKIA